MGEEKMTSGLRQIAAKKKGEFGSYIFEKENIFNGRRRGKGLSILREGGKEGGEWLRLRKGRTR